MGGWLGAYIKENDTETKKERHRYRLVKQKDPRHEKYNQDKWKITAFIH